MFRKPATCFPIYILLNVRIKVYYIEIGKLLQYLKNNNKCGYNYKNHVPLEDNRNDE